MPMARELLRPEDATNWDDFLDRIALERSARSARRQSFPVGSVARLDVARGALPAYVINSM